MWGKARFAGFVVLALVLLVSVGVSSAVAAMVAEFDISLAAGDQIYPSIYGNKIVWQDQRGPSDDIYVHDLLTGTESAVTAHPSSQRLPDIYQDLVVYQDDRNGAMDVFVTDLATGAEQQLTPTGTRQDHAAIWGDTVVWRDQRNITYDIYARSLSTGFETRLTVNPADQEDPDVCGDLVVYQDMRNGNWDIYAYDLSVGNESQITTQGAEQSGPRVADELIAWTDYRLGTADVWAYDLSTQMEYMVAGGPGDQVLQAAYGDRVVWNDSVLLSTGVYDASTASASLLAPSAITGLGASDIYGDKIAISGLGVVSGDYDIVMVTIDEDAPTTTASGIPSDWVSVPVTVTLTADDTLAGSGIDETYYSLNGAPATTYAGQFVVAAEGTTQIDFWSQDIAGNVEATQTAFVKIDTLAPGTTSDIDPAWQEGPVTVALTTVDGDGSGVAWTLYSVDGGPLQTYSTPFVVSGEGEHVVSFTSADQIGHAEILHTQFVRIDNSDPITTSDIDSAWQNGPVSVTLSVTEPYSGVADTFYSVDGSIPSLPYTGPFAITAEGTTTVKYYSVDNLSHAETVTTEYVRIDNTTPASTSDIDPAWQNGPVTVTLDAVDAFSGVAATMVSLNGAAATTYTAPFDITAEGTTTVDFYSVDGIGQMEAPTSTMVRIDNTDPITTSDIDPNWQVGPVTVMLTAADPLSGVDTTYYSTDGSFPTSVYTGSFVVSADGITTVKFYSVDTVGNTEGVTTEQVMIDNEAPDTSSDIDSAWQNGPVTVELSVVDDDSGPIDTYYSTDDSTPTVPYTAPFVITDEGTTTVKYFSIDDYGHVETITAEIVRIDNTAPISTSDIDPAWQTGPVTVTITPTDPYSGVAATYYYIDGQAPVRPYTGPFDITAEGETLITFYAVDALGHVEEPVSDTVRIDNSAPDTTSDIDSDWQTGPVTVSLTPTDPHSGVAATYYSTDGSSPTTAYAGPFVISDEGTTTVKFYSVDNYGHVEMVTTEIVQIDNTMPSTTSDIDPAWQEGPVTVTLAPTDAHSGVAETYYSLDGSAPGLAYRDPLVITDEGTTTVKYYSVDVYGHTEGVTTEYVHIDNTAPESTSDIDSDWQTGPVTVNLASTDPYSGVDAIYYSADGTIPSVLYTGPFVVSDEGTTTVHFFAMDKYGHMETVNTQILQIDNTAPSTTSDADPAWQDGPVTVTIMPTDAHSGVAETYYSLDGSAPGLAYRNPLVISDEGTTTIKYYSVDVYGHTESVTTEIVRIDNTAPETQSDIDSAWQTSPVTVTLSAADPYSGVHEMYYSVDGSVPTTLYTGPFDITAEGTTTVKFRSVDNLNHMESVTTEIVRIDDTAPVTTDDAPADWMTSPVAVTLMPTDAHSGVAVTYYSLDGSIPTVVYKNPIMISAEGTTTIKYYSVDVYGHSETVNTAIVRIDDTVPVTETDIDSAWRNTPATVTLSTNAEWIYFSVDGSEPTTLYSAPFVISDEGTTTVKYKSESKAHVFEATQAEDVRIDYTPPTTTTDAEALFWDIAYIPVEATDALSGVAQSYMRLDGGEIQETSDISVTSLGEHTVEFWSMDVAGNVETAGTHDFTVKPSTTDFTVIAGSNRISTAIKVSQTSHPDGADFVVLATGRNWPDALGGAALAGAYDAPILLVNGSLTEGVANEIRRLAPEKALILGGVGAVSEEIEGQVREIVGVGAVERFWGNTRYATADTIAFRVLERLGSAYDGTAFVVTGASFPDAVVGSPMAAANGWPIFLTASDGLTANSKTVMADIGVSKVIVLGGEGVISADVFADLEGTYGAGNVTRLAGANRYATALEAARYGTTEGNLMWDGVAVATGEQFADALTGGVLQGLNGSTMVLTRPNSLPSSVDAELEAKRDYIGSVNYLGGDAAVGPAVRSRIGQILR